MANDDPTPLPGGALSDNLSVREAADGDLSWIQRLREERDKRTETETLKLGMPTWGPTDRPDLAVEYGIVDRDVLEKFQIEARKRKKDPGAGTDIDIKFLCTSAQAVYLRSPETDKLVKIVKDGQPVRLDKRLSEMLGLDPDGEGKNSHTLVMYLVKSNTVALGSLAVTVATWMANTSREVEDELVGE